MRKSIQFSIVFWGLCWALTSFGATKTETSWGSILDPSDGLGSLLLHVDRYPTNNQLNLLTPFLHITKASLFKPEGGKQAIFWKFNRDATKLHLELPQDHSEGSLAINLEISDVTTQFPNGRIVFSPLEAQIHGSAAKLESHPGNHRIGFWTNPDDEVTWDYEASRPGMYEVELTYSKASLEGTKIQVTIAQSRLRQSIAPTQSWYRYTSVKMGRVYIDKSGPKALTVKCTHMTGGAVMNLKAITLRPTSEGEPIHQRADGSILLHARDVTIQGVKVQYEPQPHKNTVGYWVNETDWVYWDFAVDRPGVYLVEALQGCGTENGGSEVAVNSNGQELRFNVEETGHFQNFVPRIIGELNYERPGAFRLEVKPIRKAQNAVMDLRQIRLVPRAD